MRETRLGAIARAVRRRHGLRQSDLAAAAGVDRSTISHLESGGADRLTISTIRRCVEPLGMRVEVRASWRGPELDRLLDEDHAALEAGWAHRLGRWGWQTWPEVSYSGYGERGRIDLVSWHPAAGLLVIIECKTVLGDAQATLGTLDAKTRLARFVAHELDLPTPAAVVPALIFRESMTTRRHLARLDPLFRRFTLRGQSAITWLRRPAGACPSGLLIFSGVNHSSGRGKMTHRMRVRRGS